jgi:antitoxin (DNA-binding transcriptional repressor) of toxin-antitoxin stability system
MRADIHYGQEHQSSTHGPDTDVQDQCLHRSHQACNTRPVHTQIGSNKLGTIVIAKAGLPVAKLAPLEITKPKKIKFGVLAGTLLFLPRRQLCNFADGVETQDDSLIHQRQTKRNRRAPQFHVECC